MWKCDKFLADWSIDQSLINNQTYYHGDHIVESYQIWILVCEKDLCNNIERGFWVCLFSLVTNSSVFCKWPECSLPLNQPLTAVYPYKQMCFSAFYFIFELFFKRSLIFIVLILFLVFKFLSYFILWHWAVGEFL